MKKSLRNWLAAFGLSALCVHAGGFAILEQSSAGLGRGLAGMSADIENTGALFFNPAVGAWHTKDSLSIGTSMLHVNALQDFRHDNTAFGDSGGNGGGWERIPHAYYIHSFGDGLSLGLGFSATSGTATRWNGSWAGRYSSTDTEISVIDLTPSLSYKITDTLSIGLGIDIEYCDALMARMVPIPGGPDGKIKFKGDSIAFGFTAGAFYQPIQSTRIGIGYRSRMTHELDLEGKLAASGRRIKGDADCDLDLPGMVDLGIQQDINDRWTVMGTVAWTHSQVMEDLTLKFKNDALGKTIKGMTGSNKQTEKMDWRNNWRYALGTEYKYSENLTLRCGTAFDQTPVKDKHHRVSSIPDLNRLWLACGFSYRLSECCTLDVGYVHIFFLTDDMAMKQLNGTVVSTKVHGNCDIITSALTFTF